MAILLGELWLNPCSFSGLIRPFICHLVKRCSHMPTHPHQLHLVFMIYEISDFARFSNPDKILAFAGTSPTTYSSGKYVSGHSKMDKRGSKHLRKALYSEVASDFYSTSKSQKILDHT